MIDITSLSLQRILGHWGLTLFSWEKVRDVYKVTTNQGIKNLKVSPNIPTRLLFVHQAVLHLTKSGFQKMVPLIPTLQGETYISEQQFAYSLFNWIEGRQCNFKNQVELIRSAKVLAEFHQNTFGFTPPEKSNMRNHLGKCLQHFEERYQDLLRFKEMAIRQSINPFSRLYLENIDYFLPMAEKAIIKMRQSSYSTLIKHAEISKPFCHGDPAARNFIFTPNQNIFIIDFDSCRLDLPIMDLIKFTRRVMKKHHWHYQTAKSLIDSYHEVNPLSQIELEVIKAVFYFPQKFWRLSIRYFHRHGQYGAEQLLRKLQKYLLNKANLAQFQLEFENYQPYGGK